jgi:hypothetical protein
MSLPKKEDGNPNDCEPMKTFEGVAEESFVKELAELAQYALTKKGYDFPFTALIVGAECSVLALEFAEEGKPPNILYEKLRQRRRCYRCPVTFFFYCPGKEPFSAKLNKPGEEAICFV